MYRLFLILFLSLATPVWAISESSIEQLIKKAPDIRSSADLPQLVKTLTHGLKTDEDKAYVLLTWIVKNIDYDNYKMRQIDKNNSARRQHTEVPNSGDILKTRLGVCEDIANLYKKMLERADIKSEVVHGCAGNLNKRRTQCEGGAWHAWNAVWINKQWELIDPTWAITGKQSQAMEGVSRKTAYNREVRKREKRFFQNHRIREDRTVDKQWFMTDPQKMQEDHQPEDEKWLLIKSRDRKNKNL